MDINDTEEVQFLNTLTLYDAQQQDHFEFVKIRDEMTNLVHKGAIWSLNALQYIFYDKNVVREMARPF
jgi:hypothetical protein